MDIVIFNRGNGWGIANPDLNERRLPPLSIEGVRLTWRLWRADGVADDLWNAAKDYFVELSDRLNKPGVKVSAA